MRFRKFQTAARWSGAWNDLPAPPTAGRNWQVRGTPEHPLPTVSQKYKRPRYLRSIARWDRREEVSKVPFLPGGFNGSTQHQFEIYLQDFEGLNSLATVDSKETKPCLGLIEYRPGAAVSLKNYGLNQLKKVLRRPSEPALVIGSLTRPTSQPKMPSNGKPRRPHRPNRLPLPHHREAGRGRDGGRIQGRRYTAAPQRRSQVSP